MGKVKGEEISHEEAEVEPQLRCCEYWGKSRKDPTGISGSVYFIGFFLEGFFRASHQ